jgi:hypothetical protein
MTLGGPIQRDRIWFFGSYRRIQQDQTVNNAPVPRERRGNLYFLKVTGQYNSAHRLSTTFQYDRTRANNAVIRGTVEPGRTFASLTTGISSATMQITNPSAFGTRITGGPLVGANYNWVISNTKLFQFVTSWMISKPSNAEPNAGLAIGPTKIIQTNADGNILGSLTTIAQEGSFGAIDKADRSMLYMAPSMTLFVNRWGTHEFRGGADIYPFIRNVTSSDVQPVEFYFRPPGTTGSRDVLFERRTLRNFAGTGATIDNEAYERHYATYFQDRWHPTTSLSVKAGVRIESNTIYTNDRQSVLGPRLPSGFPTNVADKEFSQVVGMPNFGMAWEGGKWGVFRATAIRSYEWLDLGGGDGTSHAPYVLTTDVIRANPRGGALNETLPGQFALGVAYGDEIDGSIRNGRTYVNEFSGGWERQLPRTSSLGVTFLWRRNWDYQSGDDKNVVRNPTTGAFLGRIYPDFDAVRNTYNPNYTWQQQKSIQFMYTKNFAGAWGINSSYWYMISSRYRTRWNPTSDTLQFLGFSPADDNTDWTNPRHHARLSSFVRLPFDTMFSVFYSFAQGRRFDITTGDAPLNATAPRIVLSNGRAVSDPFFNPAYPRARRRDVDMLASDASNLVNLRVQKTLKLGRDSKIELSGDLFNLFNSNASIGFLSVDDRSANFGRPDSFVPARVGQVGFRIIF